LNDSTDTSSEIMQRNGDDETMYRNRRVAKGGFTDKQSMLERRMRRGCGEVSEEEA